MGVLASVARGKRQQGLGSGRAPVPSSHTMRDQATIWVRPSVLYGGAATQPAHYAVTIICAMEWPASCSIVHRSVSR
jgi:hypothetical protein